MSGDPKKHPTRSVPVVQEMSEEVSHAITIQAQQATRESLWRTLGSGVAIVVSTAALLGVIARALFVPQSEYNTRLQQDMVNAESFRQTMARLDKSIVELSTVSNKMNETVQDLKTGLAVISATHKK